MNSPRIEQALKQELNQVGAKLRRTQALHSAAWIGTSIGAGFIFATMTSHMPFILAIAAAGALLSLAARRFLSR